MTQIKHPFETSTRTVDEYKRSITPDMTFEEHADWLMETVAESTCGFIVRRERGSSFYYQEVDDVKLGKILNKKVTIFRTTTNTDAKGAKVTKETPYTKRIIDLVTDVALGVKLMYYDGMELYSADPHILSRYVPPQIPSDSSVDELAIKVIDFMRSRVKNPRAFDEEISSHAYRLRYPETFIEKCFVHYSKEGSTGKSFLAGLLSMMYPKLANINVHHNQLTEKYNGWTTDYMMIQVEELQGDEYLHKDFQKWIKQATMRDASVRKMYQDTTDGKNNAIIGINSNQTDLYGLATTNDQAIVTRLVILDFKEPLTPEQWTDVKKGFGLDDTDTENYSKNRERLAGSLYHYLKYTYKIVDKFTPVRYYEPEKYEVLKRLRHEVGTVPDNFVNSLELKTTDDACYSTTPFRVFSVVVDKRMKDGKKKVIAKTGELRNAWKKDQESRTGSQTKYSFDKSVEPILTRIGFEKKHTRTGDVWMMDDYDKFKEWYDSRSALETVDLDDFDLAEETS